MFKYLVLLKIEFCFICHYVVADHILSDSIDFDLQEIIDNQKNNQDTLGENGKDELMDTQPFDRHSYTNIALEEVEKQINNL